MIGKMNIKNWHSYILIATVSVICIILVLYFSVFMENVRLKKALDPKNYEIVQITSKTKYESTGGDVTNIPKDDSANGSSSQEHYSGDKIIGDDASTATVEEGSADSEQETQMTETMKKEDDVIFISDNSGDSYFYSKNGRKYVLFYDTMTGMHETGIWTLAPEEITYKKPFFNVLSLGSLSKKQFMHSKGVVVPKEEYLEQVFFDLFGINDATRDKYIVDDLQLNVKNGLLESILTHYTFDQSYLIEKTLVFSYEDIRLTLPEVQKVYP